MTTTTQDPGRPLTGTCDGCGGLRRLVDTDQGLVIAQPILCWAISARAITTVGAGRVARRCPGSGQPPRRVEP